MPPPPVKLTDGVEARDLLDQTETTVITTILKLYVLDPLKLHQLEGRDNNPYHAPGDYGLD